jgi:predicted amidophosphoribosyltransferase
LERTEGIDTIFDVSFSENYHNKHFLLIDDVITTGATLEGCAKALLKIPGAKISIVCMAMAHS